MHVVTLAKRLGKVAADNSPVLLTALGVTGAITTAVLTGRATYKATMLIRSEQIATALDGNPELTPKQQFQLVWPYYISPAASLVFTCTAIVLANRIGARRAAAVAAALSISERAFDDYKEKVVEVIGKNKEQKVLDEIAQDRINRDPVGKTEVIVTGGGDVLCYDMYTGRYFRSDMETLKKAQNDFNYKLLNSFYASLSDFYNLIGLSITATSDEVGWNSDQQLELEFSTTMSDDQKPCIAINFRPMPSRNYFRLH